MAEDNFDVESNYSIDSDKLSKKVALAMKNEFHGAFIRDDQFDEKAILETVGKHITTDQKELLAHPDWIVSVRDPHLYKELIEKAHISFYSKYGIQDDKGEHASRNQARLAEELLHGVPTFGEDAVKDRLYCVAFLFDESTRKHFTQSFFTYNDTSDNYELLKDVTETPHIILGTTIGGGDLLVNDLANKKLSQ